MEIFATYCDTLSLNCVNVLLLIFVIIGRNYIKYIPYIGQHD